MGRGKKKIIIPSKLGQYMQYMQGVYLLVCIVDFLFQTINIYMPGNTGILFRLFLVVLHANWLHILNFIFLIGLFSLSRNNFFVYTTILMIILLPVLYPNT